MSAGKWRFSYFYKYVEERVSALGLTDVYFFSDSTTARALSINAANLAVPTIAGNMSSAACTTACGNAGQHLFLSMSFEIIIDEFLHSGFTLAGVEIGDECCKCSISIMWIRNFIKTLNSLWKRIGKRCPYNHGLCASEPAVQSQPGACKPHGLYRKHAGDLWRPRCHICIHSSWYGTRSPSSLQPFFGQFLCRRKLHDRNLREVTSIMSLNTTILSLWLL